MASHPFPIRRSARAAMLIVLASTISLLGSCATVDLPKKRFNENLNLFPATTEPLRIAPLSAASADSLPAELRGKAVTVIVHPGYALFFREEHKNRFTQATYDLLKFQLDNEAQFMTRTAANGNLMILVLPGNYDQESIAPRSYTNFLNTTVGNSPTVFQVFSEDANSGTLSTETLIVLYSFLRVAGIREIYVGGGFIGRCQREFYSQLVTYLDKESAYVVPEISSISPDDITEREASAILAGMRQRDYGPVVRFIDKRTKASARTRELPRELAQ